MATSTEQADHRSVIKYCVERRITPGQTIKEMESSKTYCNASRVLVYNWHNWFSGGWVESSCKRGRPVEISESAIQTVSHVIKADRQQTVRELVVIVGISKYDKLQQAVLCLTEPCRRTGLKTRLYAG